MDIETQTQILFRGGRANKVVFFYSPFMTIKINFSSVLNADHIFALTGFNAIIRHIADQVIFTDTIILKKTIIPLGGSFVIT
ncbi:hypothetical protein [Chryseobacterium sp. NFX27]|uniref:hypothetical protein n=1 Tax=Chryseobacterium sp. NFX27 TaxID=2819618 RepID=UPI003CF8BDDE